MDANLKSQTVPGSEVDHIHWCEHDISDSIAIRAAPPATGAR